MHRSNNPNVEGAAPPWALLALWPRVPIMGESERAASVPARRAHPVLVFGFNPNIRKLPRLDLKVNQSFRNGNSLAGPLPAVQQPPALRFGRPTPF